LARGVHGLVLSAKVRVVALRVRVVTLLVTLARVLVRGVALADVTVSRGEQLNSVAAKAVVAR